MKIQDYFKGRKRLNHLINKTRSQEGYALRFNGRDIIFISTESEPRYISELTYFLGKACRGSSIIVTKRDNFYRHNICKILSTIDFNVLVELRPRDRTICFCNNINLLTNLSKLIKFKYRFPPAGEFSGSINRDNLFFYLEISSKNSNFPSIEKLSFFFKYIKKLYRNQYIKHSKYKTCIRCATPIDTFSSIMNLPLCNRCSSSYYNLPLIALKIRDNKFDFNSFTANQKAYLNKRKKCVLCKKVLFVNYLGICSDCSASSSIGKKQYIDLLLNIVTTDKLKELFIKRKIKSKNCIECGNTTNFHFCSSCEGIYDWDRVDDEMDNHNLTWEEFISSGNTRNNFRIREIDNPIERAFRSPSRRTVRTRPREE